jgi:TolA-binding protein
MLNKIVVAAPIVLLALSLTACLKTRSEMAEDNEKQVIQSQVSQIQKAKADQDANLQSYESQIRMLNGRVETLEHHVNQLSTEKEMLSKKLSENDERFKQLEQALLQVEQQREQTVTLKPAPSDDKTDKKESGKKPKSAFDEAEDFYNGKQWKKAVVLFQKYRDKSPNGPDVAAATLKIGICFQEMKMNKEAKVFYEEVLDKHSKTRFAKIAQTRLAQLKKK